MAFNAFRDVGKILQEQCIRPQGIVQVGAHVGQEIGNFWRAGFEYILLVEPFERCIPSLEKALPKYLFFDSAVECVAATDRDAEVEFFKSRFSQRNSLRQKIGERMSKERVPGMTLDTLLKKHSHPYNVLYMDTQGTEDAVLAGAECSLGRLDAVISEVSTQRIYEDQPLEEDIDRIMEGHGFVKVVKCRQNVWSRAQRDVMYVRNPVSLFRLEAYQMEEGLCREGFVYVDKGSRRPAVLGEDRVVRFKDPKGSCFWEIERWGGHQALHLFSKRRSLAYLRSEGEDWLGVSFQGNQVQLVAEGATHG